MKDAYETPQLTVHGVLKDITGGSSGHATFSSSGGRILAPFRYLVDSPRLPRE